MAAYLTPESLSYTNLFAIVLLPLLVTYAATAVGNWGYRNGDASREPPRVPYWIPVIGNTFGFAYNTEKFLASVISKFEKVPLRIFVGAEQMYYIPQGKPILELFKASRHLTTHSLNVMTLRDAFGVPIPDVKLYIGDKSGITAKPAAGFEGADPAHRFHFIEHRDLQTLLSGSSLNVMTNNFIRLYKKIIETDARFAKGDWVEIDNLYTWMRDDIAHAALESFCGEKFLELSPTFMEDFWAFDHVLPKLFKRLPRWLIPSCYEARDKAFASVLRFHNYTRENLSMTDEETLAKEWTPEFGSKLITARQKLLQTTGFSPEGAAALDLGLIWALNANAIPAALWMLLNILVDPDLKDRVITEISPAFEEGSLSLDLEKLCSGPLLNSIYCETLRLRVAAPVGRTSTIPDLKFGRWQLKEDVCMLSTSWYGGRDPDFWNTGRTLPDGSVEHPVDTFWAERFLRYPDDPASGPVRKQGASAMTSRDTVKRTADDDRKARAVTDGTQGYWYPYGGGLNMCPGRHFAKQELMVSVALVLRAYEIDIVDLESAARVKPNMEYFPFGTIPPKGKIATRIRRRKL
uniref:Cytochrome P450 n=1 Tax=Bionectria ochroleuca TaxID=29856 RepID=A0A8H7NE76_BIOOC